MIKFFKIFRVTWIVVTVIYVILSLLGGLGAIGNAFGYLTGFVGLFTPIGIFSGGNIITGIIDPHYDSALSSAIAALLLLILSLIFVDKFFDKINLNRATRVFLSALILFVLTFITDLILWKSWLSIEIFHGGGIGPF